jgi:hypothetical protein
VVESRIGVVRISVDGAWDIDDLLKLAEALSETYGLFYPLIATDEEVAARLHDTLRQQFWSGEIETRRLGRYLYHQIPKNEALRIKSFHYASPGALEIIGVVSALLMLSRVARSWIKTGDEFLALWAKVEKFFERRKNLKKPKRTIVLDHDMALGSDEARVLVFEIGIKLGFDTLSCERLIEIVGNPISTLKFLVAVGREGRKIAAMEGQGLLQLPVASEDPITIPRSDPRRRKSKPGVQVIRKRHRPVKRD